MNETNFLTVATAAIKRGFAVTPVHPQEKRGVFWGQYTHPAKNLSEVTQFSKDYPGHNVGIVSRRGVGNLAFLDIDADGVIERIEVETGEKLPTTYTVRSRPQSEPFKKQFLLPADRIFFQCVRSSQIERNQCQRLVCRRPAHVV